ncbi:pyridoxamine 5'-phosphate oxidase family protein [Pedobacter sp. HMF7647]|uniref:Pyridoxamine 5'-phosphate oxidase family protein n=1 Tax=Hufsiella arboris TaxID=2695275 RepID=A0A7K1Y9G0_9SPHI|nr:pyridoxamine 5'-phosphate oxidase family protein [Hufsiella arboris]MXV51233.1 pyridoxamine 5'-phosphate oxidase family protein [Hufsiella arboris]
MENIENLVSKEAVEKIKELAQDAGICMFVTNLTELPLTSRPMGTADVDDEGNIWFLSNKNSDKNIEIKEDKRVQLFYSNKGAAEYLSVFGEAEIYRDHAEVEKVWTPIAKAWFKQGADDPAVSAIRVKPQDVYYWDTKHNKLVTLVSILASAVSGKKDANAVEGKLKV